MLAVSAAVMVTTLTCSSTSGEESASTTTASTLPEFVAPTTIPVPPPVEGCQLLSDADVDTFLGYAADTATEDAANFIDSGVTSNCVYLNPANATTSGFLRVVTFPPETDFANGRALLDGVTDVADLGAAAYLGLDSPTGSVSNVVMVDMGDGGFGINVVDLLDYSDPQTLVDLAKQAAAAWPTDS
jgi:hypothetical protein